MKTLSVILLIACLLLPATALAQGDDVVLDLTVPVQTTDKTAEHFVCRQPEGISETDQKNIALVFLWIVVAVAAGGN